MPGFHWGYRTQNGKIYIVSLHIDKNGDKSAPRRYNYSEKEQQGGSIMPHIVIKTISGPSQKQLQEAAEQIADVVNNTQHYKSRSTFFTTPKIEQPAPSIGS